MFIVMCRLRLNFALFWQIAWK